MLKRCIDSTSGDVRICTHPADVPKKAKQDEGNVVVPGPVF